MITLATLAGVDVMGARTAKADVWDGEQIVVAMSASTSPLDARERVQMSVLTLAFWVPRAETFKAFGYLGPTLKPLPWLSVFPSVGFATDRTADHATAFLASAALTFTPLEGKIVIYVEVDGYFTAQQAEFYGFYKLGIHPPQLGPFSFGIQVEQYNASFWVGPNVALSFGPVEVGVQWHTSVTDVVGHAMRVPIAINF
ncbi:hypothetical protein A3I45_01125 [Candidatus Uhrbacteria bacterium RIFCSPLOWO2_02_FULL_53_10]|uniref:Outer membrane protein beta-barrel domain-containing protein n=1 Tax=Candidatus Uhrbacteria bacterium RIFCSPLOWO2_02_FULL_53_10 TaxID=1802411 RepID=A0A1F7VGR0_9BACT|nr:MAG: hypothetical protein A3I45_01125 [Candidatus Uhrbacteria bacterium RIFCSPLOWO2_02_FULL_53_10]